jgi:hypothetical protein
MPGLPATLPENDGLAFLGEPAWMPAMLAEHEAHRLLALPNPCGRPNSDVIRRRLAVVDGARAEAWQVDFPEHFTVREASLYEAPFALLLKHYAQVGVTPYLNPPLRRALARISRWLAMPVDSPSPDWRWIEDDYLPDDSLLVVARDDNFTQGVLSSHAFALWWTENRGHPVLAVESFPFPWASATPLSALTRVQEELRHDLARAARADNPPALNAAVMAAYGFPRDLDDGALLERLLALNQARAHPDRSHELAPGAP